MAKARPTFTKRMRERQKEEKRQRKAERRLLRQTGVEDVDVDASEYFSHPSDQGYPRPGSGADAGATE